MFYFCAIFPKSYEECLIAQKWCKNISFNAKSFGSELVVLAKHLSVFDACNGPFQLVLELTVSMTFLLIEDSTLSYNTILFQILRIEEKLG